MLSKYCLICKKLFNKSQNRSLKSWNNNAKYCSSLCKKQAMIGIKFSEEHKRKIGEKHKGNKNVLGKHWKIKDTTRMKGSETSFRKGNPPPKHKEKCKCPRCFGFDEKYRIGRIPWNKNIEFKAISGKNHWNWKGGLSRIHKTERQFLMQTFKYKQWRSNHFPKH